MGCEGTDARQINETGFGRPVARLVGWSLVGLGGSKFLFDKRGVLRGPQPWKAHFDRLGRVLVSACLHGVSRKIFEKILDLVVFKISSSFPLF